jgi:hypothetical protein
VSTTERWLVGLLLFAVLIAGAIMLLRLGWYGLTTFTLIPAFLGALAVWVVRPTTPGRAAIVGALAALLSLSSLLIVGLEGLGCIAMTIPLALPFGAMGGLVVYQDEPFSLPKRSFAILLLPVSLTWDAQARPPVFEVRTAITIAAAPEQVWKNLVAFSELPDPQEWYFRAGIAYPIRARIEGFGAGAIRYCEFSTGPFVEPIEVWDEPRLLRFRVTENPAPMHEWSPYAKVLPKHLHGYLISKQGQFRLTRLPNNRTLFEGSTWYQHGLWPAEYWRWWSDAIIHRIHLRVMNQIRALAEEER